MIKNIIFDFGGVILKHKSTLMEDKISEIFFIPSEKALEIWKKWKPKLMTGHVSSEQFLTELKNELNSDKPLSEIIKEWNDIYEREAKDVNFELLDLIEKLKKKFKVYLFTDTIDTHDEYNAKRDIYDKFTWVFKSHTEGLTKLNDDAFLNVLNKINAKPEECIFIDDLEVNVKRAEDLRIRGIIYNSVDNLKQELFKQDIIIN